MNKMKSKLYYQVLDAFDLATDFYQKRVRTLVGCAIHEDDVKTRHQHLQEAEQYQKWQREIELARIDFIKEYEPDEE